MGMYSLDVYPPDHYFWEFLSYCAGTGGSALIFGSAAGVAAMGMEQIDFVWYLRKISWLDVIGYFAGALVYMGEFLFFSEHKPAIISKRQMRVITHLLIFTFSIAWGNTTRLLSAFKNSIVCAQHSHLIYFS